MSLNFQTVSSSCVLATDLRTPTLKIGQHLLPCKRPQTLESQHFPPPRNNSQLAGSSVAHGRSEDVVRSSRDFSLIIDLSEKKSAVPSKTVPGDNSSTVSRSSSVE